MWKPPESIPFVCMCGNDDFEIKTKLCKHDYKTTLYAIVRYICPTCGEEYSVCGEKLNTKKESVENERSSDTD